MVDRCQELDHIQNPTQARNVNESGSTGAWLLPLGLLLFAMIFVPVRILDAEGLPRYRALRAELEQTRDRISRLRDEVDQLYQRVHRLKTSPQEIERIAREQGWLQRDEILFDFK
jgi:cell division protein FtsB